MLKHRWVILIPSVLNAHKFTVNICNEILVCIDIELSSQAQEVLWCKSSGVLFRAVGWNGFTRAIGFSLNGYKTTRAWVRNVSAGHQLCVWGWGWGVWPSDGCLMALAPHTHLIDRPSPGVWSPELTATFIIPSGENCARTGRTVILVYRWGRTQMRGDTIRVCFMLPTCVVDEDHTSWMCLSAV